jgi:hypothetical protein
VVVFLLVVSSACAQVLFDATKAETAGNADWVINGSSQRILSPPVSVVTASTSETNWTGGLSAWGVDLAKLLNSGQIALPGNGIETLPSGAAITYGSGSNAQDLSHYQVYVVCEPNTRFTDTEKTAILNFVNNGGSLLIIADHNGSDRNNDGWDSLHIWNELMFTNGVQTNPFGFSFNADDVSPAGTADSSPANPLTHGLGGTVTTLQYSDGATMTINNSSTTHPAVWSTSSTTSVMALYGTYGAGRFTAIGDSSVVDDGTGESGHTLFNGWSSPVDDGYCAINATIWLLGAASTNPIAPTATTGTASGVGATTATLNGTLNPNGQQTAAEFDYGLTISYGTTVAIGTFTGTTVQAVSANLTGLTPSTGYHFRLSATNASGTGAGLDQVFATAATAAVDLAVTKTHPGSFTQGDIGDTYTIIVTNVGGLGSTGTVTVTEALPAGLAATAINGVGWAADLGTLTCTRSDALAGGAAYPPIVVTVNVASNAPATITNIATVSGGGDANAANNIASDKTVVNAAGGGASTGLLAGWDVSGQTNFGPSPLPPTTNAANLSIVGLTRGSGVSTNVTAAARAWGGNGFASSTSAAAIAASQSATFSIAANTGYRVSYGTISKFDYRHSSSGATNGLLQYQIGSGSFSDIATFSYVSSSTSGGSISPIDLSGIQALQNVGAGTNVTFRIVNWGGTASGGTWYIYDVANSSAPDFAIQGTVAPVTVTITPPVITQITVAGANTTINFMGSTNDGPAAFVVLSATNVGGPYTFASSNIVQLAPGSFRVSAPVAGNNRFFRVQR